MKKIDTVRALRDADYRKSLSEAERAQLPSHPAGISPVEETILESVTGGGGPTGCNTSGFAETTYVSSCAPPGFQCP